MCGLLTAATMRAVISSRGMRSLLCTLATTTSSSPSRAGSWSRLPSSLMSHSMPVSSRNGGATPSSASCAKRSLSSAITASCCRSRSAVSPRATVRRGEWSVSTT